MAVTVLTVAGKRERERAVTGGGLHMSTSVQALTDYSINRPLLLTLILHAGTQARQHVSSTLTMRALTV